MSKYTFIKEPDADNQYDNITVKLTVKTVCLTDLLESFEDFLKGSGFTLKGRITVDERRDKKLK